MERDKLAVWQKSSDLEPTSSQTRFSAWEVSQKKKPNEAWKDNIKWYCENNHLQELNRIDGESMEFELKIFPGFTTFDLLQQIQEFMKEQKCDPEQLRAGPSSCHCSTTLHGEKKDMKEKVKVMLTKLRIMLADFLAVIGDSWDLDQKRSGTELCQT